eukprot:CAMPEP_0195526934 /NCGR_PEP_ID=MMETSP0794_2-20130614/28268_1 /TAXON_ID=515487 /ORGANISM="Stephanopyxis turris, Strain CCMP 815" /LENGTH=309 /DNA_ID=CAMNT_0040657725 /DNA_START=277 /DNA_END=1206 /DNA_ORIENTATION=-
MMEHNTEIVHDSHSPSELKVAWLLSFPNSGTSYTLRVVRNASDSTTATNYCGKNPKDIDPVVDMNGIGPHVLYDRKLPERFILTKTHCAGKCNNYCPPSKYVITAEKFKSECLTECTEDPSAKHGETRTRYDPSLVGKAVHLFRDPFDNIISRFHLHVKSSLKQERDDSNAFTNDPTGLQAFCVNQNAHWAEEEAEILGEAITIAARSVPCHADFFRYVQWHNYAFEITKNLSIPAHILHYEDYRDDFDGTLSSVMDFLELPRVVKNVTEFYWSNYTGYFTNEQRSAVAAYVKMLASHETWYELKRYFD